MGNFIHGQKVEEFLGDKFEIENGLLGAKRYILMKLIELMTFKDDLLVRNLIGMSRESVCWINHFHFIIARTFVERHIIPSKKERRKEVTIKFRNILFNLGFKVGRSILMDILIKNTILQCTIKINKDSNSNFSVGICTPNQVNGVVARSLGEYDCGGCFYFGPLYSLIICSGECSRNLKERLIENKEEITAVVNNKNQNNKGGKMNVIRNQKRVLHTIVNIPKDGVHLGFSCSSGSMTLSIISFIHVSVLPPPFNDGMSCIAYNFHTFKYYNSKDEEGNQVPNINKYFK